jgi:hypothetical protein
MYIVHCVPGSCHWMMYSVLILDFVPIYSEVRIYNYPFLNCEFHGIVALLQFCLYCDTRSRLVFFSFSTSILFKGYRGPFPWRQSSHTAELTIQFFCSLSLEHFHPGSPPDPILFKHDSFKHQEILWTPIL